MPQPSGNRLEVNTRFNRIGTEEVPQRMMHKPRKARPPARGEQSLPDVHDVEDAALGGNGNSLCTLYPLQKVPQRGNSGIVRDS